jgi:hypothetical protein
MDDSDGRNELRKYCRSASSSLQTAHLKADDAVAGLELSHDLWADLSRDRSALGRRLLPNALPPLASMDNAMGSHDVGTQYQSGFSGKPTRGFEPRTPSFRESGSVCGWLRAVALTA